MLLNEVEAKRMLKSANINTTETMLASSKEEAIIFSKKIGFPVVMKIISPDIVHKSDCGGVRLNLKKTSQVSKAYDEIINSAQKAYPAAKISGVSVQPMVNNGVEVIIGVSKDPQFGPVIMFGLGGIFVEVMKDVSFRLIPITEYDTSEMIKEIKGYQLLCGYRGQPAVNISNIQKMLLAVSDFISNNSNIKELDLNPVVASSEGAIAVDARIVVED